MEWLATRAGGTPRVLLNHGEQSSRDALAEEIRDKLGLTVESPAPLMPVAI